MEMCYQILVQEKRVTQRELYYKLLCDSPDYFTSQLQVNRTIQDLVALLRCSRYSLGIMASSRGAIAGRLLLQELNTYMYKSLGSHLKLDQGFEEPNKEIVDCSTCGSLGYAISGDLDLLGKLTMETDARYIIMHAIFQRLAEDRVFNQIPCILITAKGFPDIATSIGTPLGAEQSSYLQLQIATFKESGWISNSLHLQVWKHRDGTWKHTDMWIGLRKDDINQLIPEECLVPLKPRDLQIAKSLMSSEILQDSYKEEVAAMVESGRRAEIEALYCHGYDYLGKFLATKIVQANYL
ncbi:hypothetical protein RND71_042950 [Anisodus tanguticus]|uniref:DNA topoisomerase (ATP-hydrolyzing) n=1 Tax=Anisodus tanguticus TaxID=243964 RepID=A0AAE1QT95_9SOLA|nr:hypothetical protein RND71_042950 [Anisodus tanguticus]